MNLQNKLLKFHQYIISICGDDTKKQDILSLAIIYFIPTYIIIDLFYFIKLTLTSLVEIIKSPSEVHLIIFAYSLVLLKIIGLTIISIIIVWISQFLKTRERITEFTNVIIRLAIMTIASSFLFNGVNILLLLTLPFMAILTFNKLGSGNYVKFFTNLAFFIEVSSRNFSNIGNLKKNIFSIAFSLTITTTLCYVLLINIGNLSIGLSTAVIIIGYSLTLLYSNNVNKLFSTIKKFSVYVMACVISSMNFILTEKDSTETFTFSFFVALFTLLFTFDRIFALTKEIDSLIKDESLYYYYIKDNLSVKELNEILLPVDLFISGKGCVSARECAQQAILHDRLDNKNDLEKILKFSSIQNFTEYKKVFSFFDAKLYSYNNHKAISNSDQKILHEYKFKLEKAIEMKDGIFEPVELYLDYAYVLLLTGTGNIENLTLCKDILETHDAFLDEDDRDTLQDITTAIAELEK